MTDATNPANGQPSYPEFEWNPGSGETSGFGQPAEEETLSGGEETSVAADSGKTSGWSSPTVPAAARPAGWFPPPDGEAAPPFRHREPARSDENPALLGPAQPGPASLSSILPSFTPRGAESLGLSPASLGLKPALLGLLPASPGFSPARASQAGPAQMAPFQPAPVQSGQAQALPLQVASTRPQWAAVPAQAGAAQPEPVAAAPAQAGPWASAGQAESRQIPVVGPTEALRGRAGGPGVAVPRGAVSGLLSQERESGWQIAQRVWRDSGVDWDDSVTAGSDTDLYGADPYAASQYAPAPGDLDRYVTDEYAAAPVDPGSYAGDYYADDPYAPDPYEADDPYAGVRYAAAPVAPTVPTPADSRLGAGPWPVQRAQDDELAERWTTGPGSAERYADDPGPVQANPYTERPADRRLAPPLFQGPPPRAQWDTLEDRSGHVTLPPPAFRGPGPSAPSAPPLGESDELFRAWQGSVQAAAGGDRPGSAHWSGGSSARRPGRGPDPRGPASAAAPGAAWQVAKIGVPAVVVVTVGAVALLMLTGRANDMLAAHSGAGASSGAGSTASPAGSVTGTLAGYPGQDGSVRVAALWSANGTTLAVGYADMHPAVWQRTASGAWSLVSTAVLGTMTGHLTSVAHGAGGWAAVGSVSRGGKSVPVVYGSADGVTWAPMSALTALAGSTGQFLSVTAGPGGYLVVGKQGTGRQAFAQFWWSADLKQWTATGNSGYTDSFAAAAAATGNGFVAAGSQGNDHTVWTSSDGRHWTTHDIAKPQGAQVASLRYAAAGPGGTVVAAGFAVNAAGYLPVVVTSAGNGKHIRQVVLPTAGVPGTVTGVTATTAGFVAVGQTGAGSKQQTVLWTSPDGVTWSAATPVTGAASSKITAVARVGPGVTGTAEQGSGPAVQAISLK